MGSEVVEQGSGRKLRPKEAAKKCGISVPTLNRYVRTRPDFPRPRKLSERVTVYDENELDAYVMQLGAAR